MDRWVYKIFSKMCKFDRDVRVTQSEPGCRVVPWRQKPDPMSFSARCVTWSNQSWGNNRQKWPGALKKYHLATEVVAILAFINWPNAHIRLSSDWACIGSGKPVTDYRHLWNYLKTNRSQPGIPSCQRERDVGIGWVMGFWFPQYYDLNGNF